MLSPLLTPNPPKIVHSGILQFLIHQNQGNHRALGLQYILELPL